MPIAELFGRLPQARSSAALVAGPALEPVTLAEAKAWLRIDGSEEDSLLTALITAARLQIEVASRRILLSQLWRMTLDVWPSATIELVPGPLLSLVAIRTIDATGSATPFGLAGILVDRTAEPACLRIVDGQPPASNRASGGIEIDVLLGFGETAVDVPRTLRQAILMLVADWYENRGDASADKGEAGLPRAIMALVAPHRQLRL